MHAQQIGRGAGRSAVAAAAYRSGQCLVDDRTGQVHDYTRKRGVEGQFVALPGGGNADRQAIWNAVEHACKRGDSILAREIEVSIPEELTPEQGLELIRKYGLGLADRYGVAVDAAMHAPRRISDRELDARPDQHTHVDAETGELTNGNRHAHILMSAVYVDSSGKAGKKCVELDPIWCARNKRPNAMDTERALWADLCNAALAEARHTVRVDHRSHAERGITATPSVHLGPIAAAIERRTGAASAVRQRAAAQAAQRAQLQGGNAAVAELDSAAEIAQIKAALAAAEAQAARLAAEAIEQAQRTAAEAMPAAEPELETDLRLRLEKISAAYNASQRLLPTLRQRVVELRYSRTGSYDPDERVHHARSRVEQRQKIRQETPFWNLRAWLSAGAELRAAQADLAESERLAAIPPTPAERSLKLQIDREKAAQDRLWAEGKSLQAALKSQVAVSAKPAPAPEVVQRPTQRQKPEDRDDDPELDRRPRQRG
jgi:hypothetical protein